MTDKHDTEWDWQTFFSVRPEDRLAMDDDPEMPNKTIIEWTAKELLGDPKLAGEAGWVRLRHMFEDAVEGPYLAAFERALYRELRDLQAQGGSITRSMATCLRMGNLCLAAKAEWILKGVGKKYRMDRAGDLAHDFERISLLIALVASEFEWPERFQVTRRDAITALMTHGPPPLPILYDAFLAAGGEPRMKRVLVAAGFEVEDEQGIYSHALHALLCTNPRCVLAPHGDRSKQRAEFDGENNRTGSDEQVN